MTDLTTLNESDLEAMGTSEFLKLLAVMAPDAIDRFRKMGTVPDALKEALITFVEQADKQATAAAEDPTSTPPAAGLDAKSKPAPPAARYREDDGYIPLPERLRAWWNGTPLDAGPKVALQPSGAKNAAEINTGITPAPIASEDEHWPTRIRDRVWEKNFVLPGGAAVVLEMAELSEMKAGHLAADVLPGCVGSALALRAKYSGPVTVFESDPDVCQDIEAKEDDDLHAVVLDPDKPDFGTDAFDRIFAREVMCLIPRRDLVVQQVGVALRAGGQFVFNDVILTDIAESKEALENWRKTEPVRPAPWSFGEYKEQLVSKRFELLGTTDITDDYVADIETKWLDLMTSLETDPLPPAGVDALMEEGRGWQGRVAALKSGKLRMMRIHTALKGIRNLSSTA